MPPPTAEVAKQEAGDVGRTTVDAGRQVAGTAAEQAGQVAQEAKRQARNLLGEVRGQAMDQARTGQQNAADSMRGLAGELREMADDGERHGTAPSSLPRPRTGWAESPTGSARASRGIWWPRCVDSHADAPEPSCSGPPSPESWQAV